MNINKASHNQLFVENFVVIKTPLKIIISSPFQESLSRSPKEAKR